MIIALVLATLTVGTNARVTNVHDSCDTHYVRRGVRTIDNNFEGEVLNFFPSRRHDRRSCHIAPHHERTDDSRTEVHTNTEE